MWVNWSLVWICVSWFSFLCGSEALSCITNPGTVVLELTRQSPSTALQTWIQPGMLPQWTLSCAHTPCIMAESCAAVSRWGLALAFGPYYGVEISHRQLLRNLVRVVLILPYLSLQTLASMVSGCLGSWPALSHPKKLTRELWDEVWREDWAAIFPWFL